MIDDVVAQLATKPSLTLAVGSAQIKLTHLDRVYWPADPALKQPAQTKRDLLRYLAQVSPLMLPHLADRPLTMIRMPDGIGGQRFFQKHWEQRRPEFVDAIVVFSETQGRKPRVPSLQQPRHAAVAGAIRARSNSMSGIRVRRRGPIRPRRPTTTPARSKRSNRRCSTIRTTSCSTSTRTSIRARKKPATNPSSTRWRSRRARKSRSGCAICCSDMSLEPIVKTSGKTGLHVFVPIKRTIDFDAARKVSELVGRHLMRRHPEDITMEWSVPKRTGKIFMDYNMNVRGKTLNVAYSPRGAPGAPVSMPLTWDELAKCASARLSPRQCGAATGRNRRSLARGTEPQAKPRTRSHQVTQTQSNYPHNIGRQAWLQDRSDR